VFSHTQHLFFIVNNAAGMINQGIEQFVVWPRYLGRAILSAQEDFPNPFKNPYFQPTTVGSNPPSSTQQPQEQA
jgi:hypothetical protein